MTEMERLESRFKTMRMNGLSDLKFSFERLPGSTPESIAAEANEMLDAIDQGNVTPLLFTDSHRHLL